MEAREVLRTSSVTAEMHPAGELFSK